MDKRKTTVGKYLIERLAQIGIRHIFGIPGDYALKLFDLFVESPIEVIGTCNELNAGYAADAYARFKGVGAVCVTYGVGAFSMLNAIAGAYAEHVPVIAICGGPRRAHRKEYEGLLHHTAGHSGLQREVFEKITAASMVLDDPDSAPGIIDAMISDCLLYRLPVFMEIPSDIVGAECDAPKPFKPDMSLPVIESSLKLAVSHSVSLLKRARKPAILVGGAFSRMGIIDSLIDFVRHTGYPVASVINSKGMLPEDMPEFAGIYCAKLLKGRARRVVEGADVLLALGLLFSDFNVGFHTDRLDLERIIYSHSVSVRIGESRYEGVPLDMFMNELRKSLDKGVNRLSRVDHPSHILDTPYKPRANARLTSKRFWMRINRFLEKGHAVVADAGSATLESAAMHLPKGVSMLAQDFYLSIGYSLPASMGVKFAAPGTRPVVMIGDGAFQMTCQELSTIIRNRQNTIVLVINNDGYQIERVIYDNVYNDIQQWRYHLLPEAFGGGLSFRVATEGELEEALGAAARHREEMVFIEVCLGRFDYPPTLEKLGRTLR